MEEKDLKTKIQEKIDETILKILDKEQLTFEDFKILNIRLEEMKSEEQTKNLYSGLMSTIFAK